MGQADVHRVKVPAHHSLIAQRTQLLQLAISHPPACRGEPLEDGLRFERLVKGDEFAQFISGRMAMSRLNGGQLERQEYLGLVPAQGQLERSKVVHRRKPQLRGNRRETEQSVSRSELLGERMPIAQPFGGIVQSKLSLLDHVTLGRVDRRQKPARRFSFYRALPGG